MRALVFGDTHAPFHDPLVVKLILKVIFEWKPDLVIHNGDMFDCDAISRFPRDPARTERLHKEMLVGHHILGLIPESIKRVFCLGNHEDRIRKYFWRQAPELFGFLAEDQMLGLENIGWHTVPYLESFKIGDLVVSHDFGRHGASAVKHAAELHPGRTVVVGHTHRLESHSRTAGGIRYRGLNTGWGGDEDAIRYLHKDVVRAHWKKGFVAGHLGENGDADFRTVRIRRNYSCRFEGQEFSL